MSTLQIQVEPLQGVEKGVVVRVEGALDQPTRDVFLNRLKTVLSEGNCRCVLDMERVSYANSTAIGDLVILHDLFHEAGGGLVLLRPQRKVSVIIEMVGVDSVLHIFGTLDEARADLSAPKAAPPPPKPAAAEGPQRAGALPPTAGGFPARTECVSCSVMLEFTQAGRYRCPHCGAVYGADAAGHITAARARIAHPIELTLPCHPRALAAFQQLVAALPAWPGYTDIERARLENCIAEICTVIHQKAYEGRADNTFQVHLLYRDDELAIRVADHGKTLSRAAFPVTAEYMTEFEHRPRPGKGNYLKMAKRPASS